MPPYHHVERFDPLPEQRADLWATLVDDRTWFPDLELLRMPA